MLDDTPASIFRHATIQFNLKTNNDLSERSVFTVITIQSYCINVTKKPRQVSSNSNEYISYWFNSNILDLISIIATKYFQNQCTYWLKQFLSLIGFQQSQLNIFMFDKQSWQRNQ